MNFQRIVKSLYSVSRRSSHQHWNQEKSKSKFKSRSNEPAIITTVDAVGVLFARPFQVPFLKIEHQQTTVHGCGDEGVGVRKVFDGGQPVRMQHPRYIFRHSRRQPLLVNPETLARMLPARQHFSDHCANNSFQCTRRVDHRLLVADEPKYWNLNNNTK